MLAGNQAIADADAAHLGAALVAAAGASSVGHLDLSGTQVSANGYGGPVRSKPQDVGAGVGVARLGHRVWGGCHKCAAMCLGVRCGFKLLRVAAAASVFAAFVRARLVLCVVCVGRAGKLPCGLCSLGTRVWAPAVEASHNSTSRNHSCTFL